MTQEAKNEVGQPLSPKENAYAALNLITNLLLQASFPLAQHQHVVAALQFVESLKAQVAPETVAEPEAHKETFSDPFTGVSEPLPFSGLAAMSAQEEANAQANMEAAKQRAEYQKEKQRQELQRGQDALNYLKGNS